MKFNYNKEQWSYIATSIAADILDNKITLKPEVVEYLFNGDNDLNAEDLLAQLVLPVKNDWDSYLKEAVEQWSEFELEAGKLKVTFKQNDKRIAFCNVCHCEDLLNEFIWIEEKQNTAGGFYSCPDCGSIAIKIQDTIDDITPPSSINRLQE